MAKAKLGTGKRSRATVPAKKLDKLLDKVEAKYPDTKFPLAKTRTQLITHGLKTTKASRKRRK
jgi:hypothetical protein